MISVVIPLYNKDRSIRETVYSVLGQSFSEFELIIVNDGSTDESLKIVSEITDPRISLINQQNEGVSAARNAGIRRARYNYIALLDGDDLWDSTYLMEMNSFIHSFPDAVLYGCGYLFQNSDSTFTTTDLGLKSLYKGYIDYFVLAKNNTLFTSSSVVFEKDAFIKIGEFDKKLTRGEDIDLWIRFALNEKVAFYNRPLVIYKLDAENRAKFTPTPKEKCLIWNLDKYKTYEIHNPVFKEFLDNWRLAHIHNYLIGESTEVTEITSLLNAINMRNRSFLWIVLKHSPKAIQPFIYRTWISVRSFLKRR
jgi:glycosyltransferase involved in cell wall biosynthesis